MINIAHILHRLSGEKKKAWNEIQHLEEADLAELREDYSFRIESNFKELTDLDDYETVLKFLENNFTYLNYDFMDIFRGGDLRARWIKVFGSFIGDFVIAHSKYPATWKKEDYLKVEISRESGAFLWDPFFFVERKFFFDDPPNIGVVFDLLKKQKC
jgi:hypothetical protein